MATKVVILALLPAIVGWVVLWALWSTLMPKALQCREKNAECGIFDPTEGLSGIL